jgi:hypothetical protein
MNKSVFTFGLLASSLVMLVVMPLLNNNNSFSNTTFAQEYDKYGDSSYSQYPTGDKKYECRTGSFEGFFVSSVEFCKHVKFDKDDRKDNRTGTQGPAGPAGPAGPNELNSTSFYTIFGDFAPENSTAFCNSGDTAISGGYRVDANITEIVNIDVFEKLPNSQGWQTIIFDFGGNATVQTSVDCFNNP